MLEDRPSDDPNREKRLNPRVDLFQAITCESLDGLVVESQVADLSVGGMFIDMPRTPFAAGTLVLVRFALRADEPSLALDAEVSDVQERIGTGVRFVGLEGSDHDRIAAYVDEARRRKGLGGPPLRKSSRVFIQVPVRVKGARTNGPAFDEETRIVTLSKHGACLVSTHNLEVGMKLRLETASGREFLSDVVWVGQRRQQERRPGRRAVPRPGAGKPKTYYASLVHDALYQFLPEMPDGKPLDRARADLCFLRLMEEHEFALRYVYYFAVRAFGGLTRPITRRIRDTYGGRGIECS